MAHEPGRRDKTNCLRPEQESFGASSTHTATSSTPLGRNNRSASSFQEAGVFLEAGVCLSDTSSYPVSFTLFSGSATGSNKGATRPTGGCVRVALSSRDKDSRILLLLLLVSSLRFSLRRSGGHRFREADGGRRGRMPPAAEAGAARR